MGSLREFGRFVREHPLWCLAPVVLFYLVLAILAWREGRVPDSPFIYRNL